MTLDEPPPEIGPHEGRELRLMLSGAKPLAYFSELVRADFDWPDDAFEPHVQAGRLVKQEFTISLTIHCQEEEIRCLYFALPGEEWRIEKAHANRMRGYTLGRESEADSREMGQLLGYSEHQIDVFLTWRAFVRSTPRD